MNEQISLIPRAEAVSPPVYKAEPEAGALACSSVEDGWSGINTAPAEKSPLHSSEEADKIRGHVALYTQKLGRSALRAV